MVTDHKNLTYFQNTRITNRQQAQWTLKVQDILFRLKYWKEKDNVMTNALFWKEYQQRSRIMKDLSTSIEYWQDQETRISFINENNRGSKRFW